MGKPIRNFIASILATLLLIILFVWVVESARARTVSSKTTPLKPSRKSAKALSLSGLRYTPVRLQLQSRVGNHFQKTVTGLQIDSNLIAVRWGSGLSFQDLWIDNRPVLSVNDRAQLKMRNLNVNSQWMVLQTDRPILRGPGPSLPVDAAATEAIREILAQRHVTSLGRSESEIVSGQIQSVGDKIAQSFELAKSRLIVDHQTLTPLAPGMRCHTGQPKMSHVSSQQFVSSVQGVQCELERSLDLGANLKQEFQIQTGALRFLNMQMSSEQRWSVVKDLADSSMKNFADQSTDIARSTATRCESVEISESQSDVYFCTRGFRGLLDVNDSFLFMGRIAGGKYIYHLVRASSFSSAATQRIFQHLIRVGEKSE